MTVQSNTPFLSESTIVPEKEDLFIPYFNQLYADIVNSVNTRDSSYFVMDVTDVAQDIPNLANFGSFTATVSGQDSSLPCLVAALAKSDQSIAGVIASLTLQTGTGDWAGSTVTITSTLTNFQISHDRTGEIGKFNIRIIGTQ